MYEGKKWSAHVMYFQMNKPICDTCCYIWKKPLQYLVSSTICKCPLFDSANRAMELGSLNLGIFWKGFNDSRQYYVLFDLEWFHISWRVQLARIITSDFLGRVQSNDLPIATLPEGIKGNWKKKKKTLQKVTLWTLISAHNENVLSFKWIFFSTAVPPLISFIHSSFIHPDISCSLRQY